MALDITTDECAGVARVRVAGEVDVSCASELRDALEGALGGGAGRVVCDLSDMSFIDSTGIGVLIGFAGRAREAGVPFELENANARTLRTLRLLGLDDQLRSIGDDATRG